MDQPENKNMNKISILQWNIQGIRSKYQELSSILRTKKVSVACLQETLLGDANWQPTQNYKMEKSPHIGGDHNRGVAIMVHSTLQYTRVRLFTTLEAVAITVNFNKQYTVCSIYLSPSTTIRRNDIRDLIRQLPRPFLVLGDFNAKHPLWDSANNDDARGRDVASLLTDEAMGLLGQGAPTHYHIQTNKFSTIDLSLCTVETLRDFEQEVDSDLHGSDHFPIYLTSSAYIPQHQTPRWINRKADWKRFSAITEEICNVPEAEPIEYYGCISDLISKGATKSIPKSDGYYRVCPVPWWNANCENLKKERQKAQKQMMLCPTTTNRVRYKKMRGKFQRTQKDAQKSSWIEYVSTVNSATVQSKVWKRIDKIRGKHRPRPPPTLKVNNTEITDPLEVATVLAEHYAEASKKTKNLFKAEYRKARAIRKQSSFNKRGGHSDNQVLNAPFTITELETQLAQCKDSAPGPDDITISMIEHLSPEVQSTLLKALNKLWESGQFPEQWRKEIKLPFLKPGKDPKSPASYRPISLTSCICKLFERMINHRLMWFLEKNNILCAQQCGFRQNRSTMDALTQLSGHIQKGFTEKKHTTAVFFDLEKAYDTVWRPEILNSLYRMGLRGNLPIFIENFVSSRKFCVRVGASHSDYVEQEEGLPQGSVLSVTCFAVAINEIAKQLSTDVQCTLYVDDFVIFTSAVNPAHSSRLIQTTINRLVNWTKTKGMMFSNEKSVAIKFEKRKKGDDPQLIMYGKQIQVRESTHYLGLVVDKRLNWRSHIEHLRARCIPAINLLKHLSHLSWGADRQTLLHLYTALVKSKLDYGAQVYGTPETKSLDRLNPIQNECLRACTGAFKSSPAASLCVETGVPPLKYSRDIINLNYFFKTVALQISPTHKILVESAGSEQLPKREHINALLTQYQLRVPKIWPISTPKTPPWTHTIISVCPFIEIIKANRPSQEIRADFIAHLEVHSTVHIYTDGSKMDKHVGFAAVAPNFSCSGGLPSEASIFTAELYAIKAAISKIVANGGEGVNYSIFSDSRSALMALKRKIKQPPIIIEIKELIQRAKIKNIEFDLCWVPGHVDIAGNEKADAAAKDAALTLTQEPPRAIPHTDMKRTVREAVFKKWQEQWNSLDQEGRKLREIKKNVEKWKSSLNKSRRIETALSRLRVGHTNITHTYLMQSQANPPECERCRKIVTVKHLLLECRKYTQVRNKYFSNPTLLDILGESSNFSINKIIGFLKETGLLAKI